MTQLVAASLYSSTAVCTAWYAAAAGMAQHRSATTLAYEPRGDIPSCFLLLWQGHARSLTALHCGSFFCLWASSLACLYTRVVWCPLFASLCCSSSLCGCSFTPPAFSAGFCVWAASLAWKQHQTVVSPLLLHMWDRGIVPGAHPLVVCWHVQLLGVATNVAGPCSVHPRCLAVWAASWNCMVCWTVLHWTSCVSACGLFWFVGL
jgi:hypothetical protein